jgi:hypothetical protein
MDFFVGFVDAIPERARREFFFLRPTAIATAIAQDSALAIRKASPETPAAFTTASAQFQFARELGEFHYWMPVRI